jgi:hypothetical protein
MNIRYLVNRHDDTYFENKTGEKIIAAKGGSEAIMAISKLSKRIKLQF